MKKIQVTNLLTLEKTVYVNDLSLAENIISSIIQAKSQMNNLTNKSLRDKIRIEHPINTGVSTVNNQPFAYSIFPALHAKFI